MEDHQEDDWLKTFNKVESEVVRIKALAQGIGEALATGLENAIGKGLSLRSLMQNIAKSFADIALKAALQPVGNMFSDLVQGVLMGSNPALPKVQAFAKGGIINRPIFFPQAGNWGLAGEAGAEAILPLRRDGAGRLGVAASAAAAPVHVSMTVNAADANSFQRAEAEIGATLLGAVRRGRRAS